jgi:tellurite resistance protein TerA
MTRNTTSTDSLAGATRSRAKFSRHKNSKGAEGFRIESHDENYEFLSGPGQTAIINPKEEGFKRIKIGAAWDNVSANESGFFGKLLHKAQKKGVDIDLGCLYELKDGSRGAIQAFGDLFGSLKKDPYIALSGDERTGDAEGDDEYIIVNGKKWPEIARLIIYVYIYDGAPNWAKIKPQIHVRVPDETPMIVTPRLSREELNVCVIAEMENVRNGIKLTNHTEYFPGHAEMDRAFGFGIEWADGQK